MTARGVATIPKRPTLVGRHRAGDADESPLPALPRRVPGATKIPAPLRPHRDEDPTGSAFDHSASRSLVTAALRRAADRTRGGHRE